MNPKIILVCVIVALVHKCKSACICGFGEGTDVCSDGAAVGSAGGGAAVCQPMVVRPAPLPSIPFITGNTAGTNSGGRGRVVYEKVIAASNPSGLAALRPVGDLCSCRQTLVSPATVPRPACAKCGGGSGGSGRTIYDAVPAVEISEDAVVYQAPVAGVGTNGGGGIPADAVSLGIVYSQSQRSCHTLADDRLWYGPGKLPLDRPIVKASKSRLPETNLYQIRGVPIELKPIPCQRKVSAPSLDEEAMEEMLLEEEFRREQAEEEGAGEEAGRLQLTYGELGYKQVAVAQPKFIAIESIGSESGIDTIDTSDDASDGFVSGQRTITCNDGYLPGNVIIKSLPQREVYLPSPGLPPISCVEEVAYPALPTSDVFTSSWPTSGNEGGRGQVIFETVGSTGGCN